MTIAIAGPNGRMTSRYALQLKPLLPAIAATITAQTPYSMKPVMGSIAFPGFTI
jgi:hypothetical protein